MERCVRVYLTGVDRVGKLVGRDYLGTEPSFENWEGG